MQKLSKVLAFALAFAMTLSMGSFAATFVNSEFSDIDQASNPDAISQLAALDIMNGYTDGTIRPNGDITRAEIAKMIYVIKMGGKDDGAAYYKSVRTNLTDVEGHWGEGYIKYCYSTGVIAGRDDNKFYPDDNVTGVELAKMLLVIQGYDAQKSGLVGAGWSNHVVELGAENEYFKGYNTLLSNKATREGAASVIVNALDATIVTWSDDAGKYIQANNNQQTESIGKRYFGLTTYEGVLLSTGEYAIAHDTDYDGDIEDTGKEEGDKKANAAKHKISINCVREDDEAVKNATKGKVEQFSFDEDATDLIGQYVKISADKNKNVYGIYAVADKNTVVDTTVDKVVAVFANGKFDNKIEIDGKSYKVNTGVATVFTDGEAKKTSTIDAFFKDDETYDASSVRFIDHDGDGRFDLALVNPILAVREVTSATNTSFSAGGKVEYDDIVYPEKFKKGDYVVKTTNFYEGKDEYNLAAVVEGEVTSTAEERRFYGEGEDDYNDLTAVELDDENWYTAFDAKRASALTAGEDKVDVGSASIATNPSVGGTQKVVAVGNVMYHSEVISKGASDIAFVTELGAAQTTSVCKMKLLFSDGSSATVNCTPAEDAGATIEGKVATFKTLAPAEQTPEKFSSTVMNEYASRLVSYEINDDGEYELTLMESGTVSDAGYGAIYEVEKYDSKQNRVVDTDGKNSYIVDNNAVVFVQYKENADDTKNKYTVISGEELLDFSKAFGGTGYAMTSKNGVKSASVILLIDDDSMPGSELNKGLAVITSNASTETKIGSTKYKKLTAWTLDGEKVLYVSNSNASGLVMGSAFTYNLDADNKDYAIAKDITPLEKGAIYYVDGNKSVAISRSGETVATETEGLDTDEANILAAVKAYAELYNEYAKVTGTDGDPLSVAHVKAIKDAIATYNGKVISGYQLSEFVDADPEADPAVEATYSTYSDVSDTAAAIDTLFGSETDSLIGTLKDDYNKTKAGKANKCDLTVAAATEDAEAVTNKDIAEDIADKLNAKVKAAAAALTDTYKISSDIKVLNVDTKTSKISGVDDDSIYEANKVDDSDDEYVINAYFHADEDENEVDYIVVDVNGEWKLK